MNGDVMYSLGRADTRWQRWGALSGFVAAALGAAAMVFERGPLTADMPAATVVDHLTRYRTPMLVQSMLFLAGAALYLWYLGSLRTYLQRAEGGRGRLSGVALAAGSVWVGVNLVAQAFQIGWVAEPAAGVPPALIGTANAVFTIAALPLAVMMTAVAAVSLRHRAFPSWLGWMAAVTAAAQALLWVGTAVSTGPLAPDGWLSYALYPMFLIWLIPATAVMLRQPRHRPTRRRRVNAQTRPRTAVRHD